MHPSISQTLDHYRRLAAAVSIPVVLYHNAGGTNIDPVDGTSGDPVRGKGDRRGQALQFNPDRICEILQVTDRKLVIYAGIDTVAFEGLCHGAHGWISGIPSIVPAAARRLYETIALQGDLPAARLHGAPWPH